MSRLVERRFGLFASGWILSLLVLAGCQLGVSRFASCPFSYEEQKTALLKIAPIGTHRDAAVKKLKEAGIRGSFGIRNSVYYCDSWEQEVGQRWHLDLALLFDESGRLYEIRPAQFLADSQAADVSKSAGVTGGSEKPGGPEESRQSGGSSPEAASESAVHPSSPASANPARSGRRTPFAQDEPLPTM